MSASMPQSSGEPLKSRLEAVMQSCQLPIAPGCKQNLVQLIRNAEKRVWGESFAIDRAKLREAETNFRRLLTEMIRQAGVLGFNELHEQTLNNALSSLCPICPFC